MDCISRYVARVINSDEWSCSLFKVGFQDFEGPVYKLAEPPGEDFQQESGGPGAEGLWRPASRTSATVDECVWRTIRDDELLHKE